MVYASGPVYACAIRLYILTIISITAPSDKSPCRTPILYQVIEPVTRSSFGIQMIRKEIKLDQIWSFTAHSIPIPFLLACT